MRCRTHCFESPKNGFRHHKPSRSEDYQFTSHHNLSRVSTIFTNQQNLSHVSANSVNYSSVHELSVLLEHEREQNQRLIEQVEAIAAEKSKIIASQERKIAALNATIKKLQNINKRLLQIDVEPSDGSESRRFKDYAGRLREEMNVPEGLPMQAQMDAIVKSVVALRHAEREQNRFVQCIKDLISQCVPRDYFGSNDPTLKQVWKCLKSMLSECLTLKHDNQRYKEMLMHQAPRHRN